MADNPYTNKVVYAGQTLIDLTGDTATAADVAQGKIFHLASGEQAIGTAVSFKPQIIVTAPTGSTVTATDGTTTLTATESGGTWTFDIPNYGTWTVTATLGAATASDTVSVTEVKQYTLTLAYFEATLNITAPSGATVTVTKDGATVNTHTATGSAVAVSVYEPGTYTVTATSGEDTASDTVVVSAEGSYSLTLSFVTIVGVCWNWGSPSTALSRLTAANDPNGLVNTEIATEPVAAVGTGSGSSPFDSLLPWSGMYECNHSGSAVTYRKGESGFSRTGNDTVIWIPVYYSKVVNDVANSKTYYYSASANKDGFTKMEGSGKFIGRYKTGSGYYSKSGLAPQVNMTRGTCRTQSKAKGGKWRMNDYATWCAYTFLYLVEFADWDSQSKIGRGYVDGNSAAINTGGTDSMTYHTGRAAGTDGKVSVQYRGIEDPWGDVYEWVDGINFSERKAYVCTDPSKYADATSTGYTDTGVTLCESGWITKLTSSTTVAWAFSLPTGNGGSETTYIPDSVASNTGWRVLAVGGGWDYASRAGLLCFSGYNGSSDYGGNFSARLLVDS